MSFALDSISNAKRIRAPRIVLLGTPGIGKSELAGGSDDPIFLPVKGEEGIDALDVQAFPVITSYDEFMEALESLYSKEHNFRTLVLDSTSTFAPIVDDAALQVENVKSKALLGGGWGRQWDTITRLWSGILAGLSALRDDFGMSVILIGHVKIKAAREPETESFDQWTFDIDGRVADQIIRWSDCTLFMNRKTVVKKEESGFNKKEKRGLDITGGQRFLFTQQSPTHPAKTRGCFGELPAEIALPRHNAWEAFMGEVAQAISKQK